MMHTIIGSFISAFAIIILDRVTKIWALQECGSNTIEINTYVDCVIVNNSGMAWSLFASNNNLVNLFLLAIILLVTVVLAMQAYYRLRHKQSALAEILIIAGSIGNSVDRIRYGSVIDFIHLHYNNFSWPVFNVADVCIVIGIGLLFVRMISGKE